MSISSVTIGGKIKYKLVLLGNQHVGKSSIIERFINDRFEQTYNATIGIDFLVRNILHNNKTYRLQLWDTAGQQRFKALIPSYLKDSNCALIIYDINSPQSLKSVRQWIGFYNQHKQQTAFGVLVGNKSDLSYRKDSCTQEQIQKMVSQIGLPSYKISAKTGQGIQQLFISLIELILQHQNKDKKLLITTEQKTRKEQDTQVQIGVKTKTTNIKLDQEIKKQIVVSKGCC